MSFEVEGLEEWKQKLLSMANEKFPQEKQKELKKIAYMAEAEIKPLIPVDTGRLRNSVFNQMVDSNTSEVVVATEYASFINDGHLTRNGTSFVLGKHFMEKGLQNAEPKIMAELNSWLDEKLRKLGE